MCIFCTGAFLRFAGRFPGKPDVTPLPAACHGKSTGGAASKAASKAARGKRRVLRRKKP